MQIVNTHEIEGEIIPDPYKRLIKIVFSSDKNNIPEINFSSVSIFPKSRTDYHGHDRPELIYIVSGEGMLNCNQKEYKLKEGIVIWLTEKDNHQIINTGNDFLKIVTVFIPGYDSNELLGNIIESAERDKK